MAPRDALIGLRATEGRGQPILTTSAAPGTNDMTVA